MKKADILEVLKKEEKLSMDIANSFKKGSERYNIYMAEAAVYEHVIGMFTDDKYAKQIKDIMNKYN